jgi:(1->4)-alpha-D-glucan 1-alpha-D-glucosylmutase
MLASATHDHKRGEDSRARLAVLSAVPDLWREAVGRWSAMAQGAIHPADRYQLFQTLIGAWPDPGNPAPGPDFAPRIEAWLEKALREARLRSSWEAPDEAYEGRAKALLTRLLESPDFTQDMGGFVARIAPAALAYSLAQTALKYCVAGVPDLYQGCEALDLSLVDPDNRRPVDYGRRAALLSDRVGADGQKVALIRDLLRHRAAMPDLFASGSYHPLTVSGERADHVLAFERRHGAHRLTCALFVRGGRAIVEQGGMPPAGWWQTTTIAAEPALDAATIFASHPYFINLR